MATFATAGQALDSWILADQRCISYKYVSRALGIPTRSATELMAQWKADHPTVHATWTLAGTRKSEPIEPSDTFEATALAEKKPRGLVLCLAGDEQLETTKSSFTSISSCQIYSLEPGRVSSLETVLPVNHDISNVSKLSIHVYKANCASIIHHQALNIMAKTKVPSAAKQADVPHLKQAQRAVPAAPMPAAPKSKAPPVAKRSSASLMAQSFGKLKPAAKNATGMGQPAEREPVNSHHSVSVASASDISSGDVPEAKKASTSVPDVGRGTDKTNARSHQQVLEHEAVALMMEAVEEKPAVDAGTPVDMKMDDADEVAKAVVPPADTAVASGPSESETKQKRRGRKRVKRQVHTQDEKGYLVTKDEWDWVSCSEEESQPSKPALPKAQTKAKPVGKKKAGGSIASYFTKK